MHLLLRRQSLQILVTNTSTDRKRPDIWTSSDFNRCVLCELLTDPAIPEEPSDYGANTSDADDGDGRDTRMDNAVEAAYEDNDRAELLDNDC